VVRDSTKKETWLYTKGADSVLLDPLRLSK